MDIDYEDTFKISLRAMRANQSDPAVERDLKWFIRFIILHSCYTVFFLIILYNIVCINLKQNDFSETCKNGTLSVVYVVVTFQGGIMTWKQKHLMEIIVDMKKDYDIAKSLPENEQNIIKHYAKKGTFVCKSWLLVSLFGVFLFPLKHVILSAYMWFKGEFQLTPMYYVVYPSFIEERKDNILVYIVMYILMFFYGVYSGIMYIAFVPLGPSFMLHACGQLEVVKSRVEDLFKNADVEEIGEKLKDVVKQLQYIYDFVDNIKICFRVAYELTLKATTIILPITCFQVLESSKHGKVSLEFLTFIFGGVLISSSPCFYSDLLMEKGEDLRLAVYSCGWEKVYDGSIRSTVRIVLQRALHPVAICTLFRTLCLEALTDLFQQSYTIFNLMNCMWN